MNITILDPVKCTVCNSNKIISVQSQKKIVGRFCETCKFYNCFKQGLKKVFKVKVANSNTDYLHKQDLVFMVMKKGKK